MPGLAPGVTWCDACETVCRLAAHQLPPTPPMPTMPARGRLIPDDLARHFGVWPYNPDGTLMSEGKQQAITEASLAAGKDPFAVDASHLARQIAWSAKTFGPGPRTGGVTEHIEKELVEIRHAPHDLKEWVGLIILAFDGAWRAGYAPQEVLDAIEARQTVLEGRAWPDWRLGSQDHAIEHVRADKEFETSLNAWEQEMDAKGYPSGREGVLGHSPDHGKEDIGRCTEAPAHRHIGGSIIWADHWTTGPD